VQLRSGKLQHVRVDTRAATLARLATYSGQRAPVKSWDPITGYYRVRDGEWVYLHGNFPHLRDGLLKLFNVPNDPAALRAALVNWSAADIEDAAGRLGLCGVIVRRRAEWEAHPQSRATAAIPLIEITRIADAPPHPLPDAARPLSGIRVLICHASPADDARTLAEHGATVCRSVQRIYRPSSRWCRHGFGKQSCDQSRHGDRQRLTAPDRQR
jgi:hypothetical protein